MPDPLANQALPSKPAFSFAQIPKPEFSFSRDDLARMADIQKGSEIIARALNRATTAKFCEWLRDEIAKIHQDEVPGPVPKDDEELMKWAMRNGFSASNVTNKFDPPHIRRYVLFRHGKQVAGLELNVESFSITPEEREVLEK